MKIKVGVCPGSCNTEYRAAWAAYDTALAAYDPLDANTSPPDPPTIRPRAGLPVWCSKHETRIRKSLAQLDQLAALVGYTADGHAASSDAAERVSGSADPRSPSEWADELDALNRALSGWETRYRQAIGADGAAIKHGELARACTELVAWLYVHLDGTLGVLHLTAPVPAPDGPPFAAAFGMEILTWHSVWFRRAKAGVRKITKPLRCPSCHLNLMVWVEGEDEVSCENPECRRVMRYDDYGRMVEHIAGQPVTADTP